MYAFSPYDRGQTYSGEPARCIRHPCSCRQQSVKTRNNLPVQQAQAKKKGRSTYVPGTHSAVLSPMWWAFLHCKWSGLSLWKPLLAARAANGIADKVINPAPAERKLECLLILKNHFSDCGRTWCTAATLRVRDVEGGVRRRCRACGELPTVQVVSKWSSRALLSALRC